MRIIDKEKENEKRVDVRHGGELFEFLFKRILENRKNESKFAYEITVVGHSMGAIVLNKTLNVFRDDWLDTNVLKNIADVAAACSIREAIEALRPILSEDREGGLRKPPNFYNLMLNRVAEVTETHAFGVVPTGPLLVSIDQHYQNPAHPLERTFGSEVNVYSALDVMWENFKEAGSDVYFKSFDRHPNTFPNMHGDFDETPFWLREAWSANTKTKAPAKEEGIKRFNAYPGR